MATIHLKEVTVEFPIYNVSARSFRKKFIHLATGGAVRSDVAQHMTVRALDSLTFSLNNGDRIGLVGHNGAGKSTLLRLLAGIYEPIAGDFTVNGRISPMLDLMQGIETEFTGYENIVQRSTLLGLSRAAIKDHVNEIAMLTGLGDYLFMPVRTYSSGMMLRLAFAVATNVQPEILLIDEIFGVGDTLFMEKAHHVMSDLLNRASITVMATHSDELIQTFCNKAILLEAGKIKMFDTVETVLKRYHHS